MPKSVSASAHQRMLDCPYQFFAVELLGLKPVQPYRDELEKSDYGQRVHHILQAFHGGIAGLPGPWRGPLTTANASQAQQLLMEITAAVFADDLKDSLLARGWLYRWQPLIPGYLEWQRRRGEAWTVHDTERELTHCIGDGTDALLLTGRLDRLDKADQGYAIIDYKTGEVPKLESVLTGEHAQLLFYTLLMDAPVNEALILSLGNEKLSDKLRIEAEALARLQPPFGSRLIAIHRAVREGMALPAWGDTHSCDRCSMEGLCRKAFWVGTDDAELKPRQKKGGLSTAFIG
jgi:ATP-dependent helicase/nuclease subunit B